MNRFKGKLIITFIFCFIILTIATGCLSTMIYYPARVLDKGKMYLGIGGKTNIISYKTSYYPTDSSAYKSSSRGTFANTIYFRRGLGAGFDIGCEIKGALVIPVLIEVSVRKVFKIKTNLIDGIVFDAGYGRLLGEEIYGSAAITHDNTFIRGMFSRNYYDSFDGSQGNYNLNNSIVVTVNHEFRMNRFSIMPYIMYEKSTIYTDYTYPSYTLFMSTDNITYYELTESNAVGAGVSVTFNL